MTKTLPAPTKVLIIEDELPIQQLYQFKFDTEGFEVAVASTGVDGLALAESFAPQLILLDLRMPEMNGDEMLAKLRATPWGAEIRVVVLTNISRDEAPSILRFLNVDRYIVKAHHTPAQVVATVKDVLNLP